LPWDTERGGYWQGGKHWSIIVGDETVAQLEKVAKEDKPFFIYTAFNAPHDPRQSPKEFVDMYPVDNIAVPKNFLPEYPYNEAMGAGRTLRDEKLAPFPRTEYSVKVNRQEYYAIITHMDQQIGRILDALEATGKADSTYIFFTADHGLACGNHGLIGKQNMYEDSVRAPFIVCGPGVQKDVRIETPIYLQDVMPTTLELAGVETKGVDFRSLNPLIKRETATHYDAIYGAYRHLQRMIVKDGYKLIHYPAVDVFRLFNLKADPEEMNDLAASPEYSTRLTDLKRALVDLEKSMGDPLVNAAK
jgi:choline-sulfatase